MYIPTLYLHYYMSLFDLFLKFKKKDMMFSKIIPNMKIIVARL